MAYRQRDRLATAAVYLALCLLSTFLRPATALQTVPGSPCQSTCDRAGNLEDSVVCLDVDYVDTEAGSLYRECVSCQLNSTAIDTGKNETDVEFALSRDMRNIFERTNLAKKNLQWPCAIPSQGACLPFPGPTSPSAAHVKCLVSLSTTPSDTRSQKMMPTWIRRMPFVELAFSLAKSSTAAPFATV